MNKHYLSIISLLLLAKAVFSQETSGVHERSTYRVMFYNVENLFDIENDSLVKDKAFTPEGKNHWTKKKYRDKLNKIGKTIIASGEWEPPEMVGICEIESRGVIKDLLNKGPISNFEYQFLHKESPDWRGIDVALLYKEEAFDPIDTQFLKVHLPDKDQKSTRDILYAKGLVKKNGNDRDTLHVFVNHWPSRYGGQTATAPKRIKAASILRKQVESIKGKKKAPNILIMGDFNDEPQNTSLNETLKAKADTNKGNLLVNLMHPKGGADIKGTYKYQYEWNILDQFIISKPLLRSDEERLATDFKQVSVLRKDFLLKPDNKYPGKKPYRTYLGPRYKGGFSDHLPIILDFYFKGTH